MRKLAHLFIFLCTCGMVAQSVQDLNDKGLELGNSQDWQGVIIQFTEAIKLDPNDYYAYYHRGMAKFMLKNHKEAIVDYDSAHRIDPEDLIILLKRASAKYFIADYIGAISDLSQFITELDTAKEKKRNLR